MSTAAAAAGGEGNSKADPPIPLKPKGFRMSCVARESHGNEIYAVAWSSDIFYHQDTGDCDDNDDSHDDDDNVSESGEMAASEVATAPSVSPPRKVQYIASCGGNHVSLYEVEVFDDTRRQRPSSTDPLVLRQSYVDRDSDESFYACAFGGRSFGGPFGYTPVTVDDKVLFGSSTYENSKRKTPGSCCDGEETETRNNEIGTELPREELIRSMAEPSKFDGPQLLFVAGFRGVIKVIDTVRQFLFMTLSGHGHHVYDLKVSPADEWLLLSASGDQSIRLWNAMTGAMVGIFSGHEGHRSSVLSVAWHPLGHCFASAGIDNCVKIWSIGDSTAVPKSLEASKVLQTQKWDAPLDARPTPEFFRTAYEQTPIFSTNKVHDDYVDCVQFVGDLVLSKSVRSDTIVLWKPDFSRTTSGHVSAPNHKPPSEVMVLREFATRGCNVWCIRFGTDPDCRMLAVGNEVGEIRVWDIDAKRNKKCFACLSQRPASSKTVRMLAFSPDAKCLIAACDDASLTKWDVVC